ncbi:MAG: SDR family oxidoreductase [Proteobacteria bacterium]|nr:SDR family oxidoreductase [Pseudomonadota bacterium]
MTIALITGASRGLGKSMAEHLAAKGIDLIITYHSKKAEAESVVALVKSKGRRAVALQLDVTRADSFDAFTAAVKQSLQQEWGRQDFDFLVNNAGMGMYSRIADTSPQVFDQMVDAHLKAPFFLTQKLLPLIKNGGRIVNISSGLARFTYPGFAAYAMMKGGIEVFTRYLAKELGERRITVNTIAPGAIATDFGGGRVRDDAETNRVIAAQTPLGRVGLPEDIGGAVSMLLSEDGRWINGQRIEVSGGIHL